MSQRAEIAYIGKRRREKKKNSRGNTERCATPSFSLSIFGDLPLHHSKYRNDPYHTIKPTIVRKKHNGTRRRRKRMEEKCDGRKFVYNRPRCPKKAFFFCLHVSTLSLSLYPPSVLCSQCHSDPSHHVFLRCAELQNVGKRQKTNKERLKRRKSIEA